MAARVEQQPRRARASAFTRAALLGALALACANSTPPPHARAVELGSAPGKADSVAPAESAPPPASASAAPPPAPSATEDPAIDPAVLAAEAATPVPVAPAKIGVSGAAAVVWVPDDKAARGFRSVLIEPAAGKAKVVAQRKEPILVGSSELWVLREKLLASRACEDCDACLTEPPTCKQQSRVDIKVPYLKGLGTGKVLDPFGHAFSARKGCADRVGPHDTELSLHGGVGSHYFVSVHSWDQFCGGAHPMFGDEATTFDVDTGKSVALSFPAQALLPLKKRAHAELAAGCVMDAREDPAPYNATAAYDEKGELEGRFVFTMSAPYMCGNGPGHYSTVSEQVSAWIPPELQRWGKLPEWVAAFATSVDAKHAFMVTQARLAAVKRTFQRR